jgi:hypothetical protein
VAIGIRQPMQQESMQILLLVPPVSGESWSAMSWWQMMPHGSGAVAAAARAAPKLASKLDSATA